jgi:hypothetical protein
VAYIRQAIRQHYSSIDEFVGAAAAADEERKRREAAAAAAAVAAGEAPPAAAAAPAPAPAAAAPAFGARPFTSTAAQRAAVTLDMMLFGGMFGGYGGYNYDDAYDDDW